MKTLISSDATEGHIISKYSFKVLAFGGSPQNTNEKKSVLVHTEDDTVSAKEEVEGSHVQDTVPEKIAESRDDLVESLLKKTDDISSNFIKMQMKLEAAEEEHKIALEAAKKEAYEQGVSDGRSQVLAEQKQVSQEGANQFAKSVQTLEQSANNFENALEGIQNELMHAALDIAHEVILKEISSDSQEIAKILSDNLIKELQSASQVTLKVNPVDHGAISEKVGSMQHVEVVSDSAVSPGGVIAISDAGNIDSEIMKRFAGVKKAALSGE
ncbi:MAG TPA: flagellar assembly protein FliH [Helicobacteraceae bacterium]|nr:flagellar assembly protein FliH [Helicobacteraceae bacterium]